MNFELRDDSIQGGTNCTPVGVQLRIPLAHPLDVLLRVSTVGKDFNNVGHGEIALLVCFIPDRPDLLCLEKLKVAHDIAFCILTISIVGLKLLPDNHRWTS